MFKSTSQSATLRRPRWYYQETGIRFFRGSVKNAEGIYKKLNSYSEQQWNNSKFKNMEIIKRKIDQKKDLFDRNYDYKVLEIDNSFPKYIFNNKEKFKELLYEN